MPSLRSAVPKYRRKVFRGGQPQAIVTINGRDHYLGLYGSKASKYQYDQLIGQWLACGRSKQFGVQDDSREILLRHLIVDYGKWAAKHYRRADGSSTGTHTNMRPLMRRLLSWYGNDDVADFRPLVFRDVIRRLVDERLTISTINDSISRIKHMFRWGVANELVEVTQLTALEAVQGERAGRSDARPARDVESVPDAHIELTLPHLPDVVADMVRLQRATGMRPQELCDICRDDIEFLDGAWLYRPGQHKTRHRGKSRIIVLNQTAQAIIAPYLNTGERYCFSPKVSAAKQLQKRHDRRITPLSCGNRPKSQRFIVGGERYTSCSYRRAVHRACSKVFFGLAGHKWSPNQLRHTVAEEVQAFADIEAVAAVLGHAKVDMSRVYAGRNLKLAIETMNRIADKSGGGGHAALGGPSKPSNEVD